MAMSTVVGISVATTWIVSLEGGLPPSVRVSDVDGASSTPDGGSPHTGAPATDGTGTPPALAGRGSPQQSAASRDRSPSRPGPSVTASVRRAPSAGATPLAPTGPAPSANRPSWSTAGTARTGGTGTDGSPAPDGTADADGATTAPGGGATVDGVPGAGSPAPAGTGGLTGGTAPAPAAGGEAPDSTPAVTGLAPAGDDDEGLHGSASADTADPYASRDSLVLTVDENVTALEVEVRVERTGGTEDGGAWTTMPGVSATVERAGNALVYRFTLQPRATVPPGRYSFTVQYAHRGGRHDPSGDTWLASAFGVDQPRAVAVRGSFG
ncbi:hypothetical protein [Streptomyces sp. NPDC001380]|uniref:hypothetical protein n=1 Tax=Streptomyces sp. NPDC001380 TaxID=3364566 RepID=UPI0036B8B3E2